MPALALTAAAIAGSIGSIGLGAAQAAGAFDEDAPGLPKSKNLAEKNRARAAMAKGRSSTVLGDSGPSGGLGVTSLLGA